EFVLKAIPKGVVYGSARQRKEDIGGFFKVRVPIKAGMRLVSVALVAAVAPAAEGVGPSYLPVSSSSFGQANRSSVESGTIEMGIDSLHINGPFDPVARTDTASRRRIFVCYPTQPR